jgi:predicted Zn finger-like uncharacterized protein
MKIVCDSCGAKYSIADEKVAGRVFKIRCKKCGSAIVVRGDQSASGAEGAAPAAAAAADYGGDAVWHVVVEGEQQGPFTPAQLGGMISASTIGWDAYVWREGFEDWKPAQDIEELVQQIMNPGQGAAAASEHPPADQDPFAEAASPAAKSGPPAKASASADAGADLFAQSESASPFGGGGGGLFGGGGGGEDDDVVSSSPGPRVSSSQAMTGARNENSVLFSLSNLQALATGGAGGGAAGPSGGASSSASRQPSQPAPRAGMAAGEGSGLIDIRALAGATGLTTGGSGASSPAAPARVDDLLSIGTAVPGLGTPLGAPVIIPEKRESGGGKGVIIGAAILGTCVVLAAAGVMMVTLGNQPDPATIAAADTAAGAGSLQPGVAAPLAATAPAPGVGTPTTPPAGAAPTAPAAPPSSGASGSSGGGSDEGSSSSSEGSTSSRSGSRRRASGGGGSGGGGSAPAAAAPAAAASESGGGGGGGSARSGGGGGSDIDDLLAGALGGGSGGRRAGGGAAAAPAAGGGGGGGAGPQTPSRSDVVTAMGRVQGAVAACGGGQHGTATVAIVVSGSNGRVTSATVGGQFAGTPVGSCIARAVRGATFPEFSRPTFTINYPFRI